MLLVVVRTHTQGRYILLICLWENLYWICIPAPEIMASVKTSVGLASTTLGLPVAYMQIGRFESWTCRMATLCGRNHTDAHSNHSAMPPCCRWCSDEIINSHLKPINLTSHLANVLCLINSPHSSGTTDVLAFLPAALEWGIQAMLLLMFDE